MSYEKNRGEDKLTVLVVLLPLQMPHTSQFPIKIFTKAEWG